MKIENLTSFAPWQSLLRRVTDHAEAGSTQMEPEESRVPVTVYRDPDRFMAERDIFRETPVVAAHAAELTAPNTALTRNHAGVPVVLHRDGEGVLRSFINVCRHRGAAVCDAPEATACKTFVCGYHGWTYDQTGALIHVPQEVAFPTSAPERPGLVALPVREAHGLIWLGLDPDRALGLDDYVGGLAPDLSEIGLADHVLYRRIESERTANWKLIIDLFLEAYHVRVLHRDSVYSFFLDNVAVIDRVGPHYRIGIGRSGIKERGDGEPGLRDLMSIVYFFFPGTFVLLHPDYVSVMSVSPIDVGTTKWTHLMLVPRTEDTHEAARHWRATYELIDRTVFDQEDLGTAETMQRGLATGVNTHMRFGRFEHAATWFHAELDRRIGAPAVASAG